jgi:hypothetical protein
MGDRCYMRIECRNEHAPVFEKLGFVKQDATSPGVVEMVDEEANYAHDGKLPESVPYRGWHSAGGDYGACAFACDGRKLSFTDTDSNGEPIVRVGKRGKPIKGDMAVFLVYEARERKARKKLGVGAKP